MGAEIKVVRSADEVAREAARWMVASIAEALKVRGAATVGLAGGTTPKSAYELLAAERLDWERVDFYFGDERCVPPDHPDSNYRMACGALVRPGGPRQERIHRARAELDDREAAAAEYEAVLPAALDALVLGIGEDGHTASLFPGSEAVHEEKRRVRVIRGAKPPPWRLTITPPVIRAARKVLVLAAGGGKADAVARALKPGDFAEVPARLAARDGATWLLDEAAAAKR
jgi:6-phosphogluconolactonase